MIYQESVSVNAFRINSDDMLLPVYGGYIYILSGDTESDVTSKQKQIAQLFRRFSPEINSGCGSVHFHRGEVRQAVLEAVYAASYSSLTKKSLPKYDDLGMYAFMVVPENRRLLQRLQKVFTSAVARCDKDNKLDLYDLTRHWILSGGDFAYVAKNMYIAKATVRYRLNKLHDCLGVSNANDFYAEVKLAVYAEHILNDELLKHVFS